MIIFQLLLNCFSALELNAQMGFAKTTHHQKLIVTNGHFPVPFALKFNNQLINATEMTRIGNEIVKCPETKANDLIEMVNEKLMTSFREAFEPLEMDLMAKERGSRGIVMSAAINLGLAAGQKLISKAIDYLFDSRRMKTETSVKDLVANLKVIKHDLELSALEMCALGSKVLDEKINRIASELMLRTEREIKSEIQALYFGVLDKKYGMAACLALNMNAKKIDCLKLLRNRAFDFDIISIDVMDDSATVHISIQTPIISRILIGFRYYNVGVPKIISGKNSIVKGLLPDFVTPTSSFHFNIEPLHNVIAERNLLANPIIDEDCFRNVSETDRICDAMTYVVTSEYLLENVDGHTVLLNFIPCSFTPITDVDTPVFLEKGLHVIQLEQGFLSCGNNRLTFDHVSLYHRKKITYTNFEREFNFVDQNIFKDLSNMNILDDDHVFEQVSLLPSLSFRIFLIIVSSILLLILLIGLFVLRIKIISWYRAIQRPALVY